MANKQVVRVPEDCRSIGEALNAVSSDAQIVLSPGRYRETLMIRSKSVEIVGNGNMQHLLLESEPGQSTLEVEGGSLKLKNLMVRSNGSFALTVTGGRLLLEDCNVSGGNYGVRVTRGSEATMRRSVICRCQQQGLIIDEKSSAQVESCSIFENGDHGVLALNTGSSVKMSRSMVSYNGGAGIYLDGGASGSVENNDLRNNMQPAYVGAQSQSVVTVGSNLST
mmetsp:Transcript_38401/g.59931  ORF Transcript_38401/g.59931 Transcript_38401/m.59931 type:complete len:223 (-) Transcript_38401:603-1271(-)